MTLPRPYYEDAAAAIVLYHADARDVLPCLDAGSVDLVLTDPPYPDYHTTVYTQTDIRFFEAWPCRQLIFWSAKFPFPLDYSAIHIWDKQTGCGSEYERIFERNGYRNYKMWRANIMNSTVAAQFAHDTFVGHPSQKPLRLIKELMTFGGQQGDLVLDPFLGSGTTVVAAKRLGRRFIGCDVEERWLAIAVERLRQSVLPLTVDAPPRPTQLALLEAER